MKHLRRAVKVSLYLTAFATPASAECAWVLWRNPTHWTPRDWVTVDAFSTEAVCRQAARNEVAKVLRTYEYFSSLGKAVQNNDQIVSVFPKDEPYKTITFLCLPETVDPRGTKDK